MRVVKFIKPTTVKIFADYGDSKQTHKVDYLPGGTVEVVKIVSEYTHKNKKYIQVQLPDEDIMQILAEVCVILPEKDKPTPSSGT
jgi:septum formation topological specificity factor MinE